MDVDGAIVALGENAVEDDESTTASAAPWYGTPDAEQLLARFHQDGENLVLAVDADGASSCCVTARTCSTAPTTTAITGASPFASPSHEAEVCEHLDRRGARRSTSRRPTGSTDPAPGRRPRGSRVSTLPREARSTRHRRPRRSRVSTLPRGARSTRHGKSSARTPSCSCSRGRVTRTLAATARCATLEPETCAAANRSPRPFPEVFP